MPLIKSRGAGTVAALLIASDDLPVDSVVGSAPQPAPWGISAVTAPGDSVLRGAFLIDNKGAILFTFGQANRYLAQDRDPRSKDLLAAVHPDLRSKLNSGIQQALAAGTPILISAAMATGGQSLGVDIELMPVLTPAPKCLLACFIDTARPAAPIGLATAARLAARLVKLDRDLGAAKLALLDAIQDIDGAAGDQPGGGVNKAVALESEPMMFDIEAMQALNGDLQAALQQQLRLSDDLQNVLHSTDVATVFLDRALNMRFFTPATQSVLMIAPGDVGRKLSELPSRVQDFSLGADAAAVLGTQNPQEREVEAPGGLWYCRRIMPYRTHDNRVEGVVVTYNDITKRKCIAAALEEAKRQAEQANIGKSRFLAAASHDLRQPLQTLALLQGLLAKSVHGERAQGLVARVDDMLAAMSLMLDRLLDINEIETGVTNANVVSFDMNEVLTQMRDEFSGPAQSKGLSLRVMPCSLHVRSDPELLAQITRNLLSNAIQYTKHGKILLGCRRRGDRVSMEVWDTGIGIPAVDLSEIFEEYHQLDNVARERSRGLGLGLSIVNRLATLLDHPVSVRSKPGKGSLFGLEIGLAAGATRARVLPAPAAIAEPALPAAPRRGSILAVEDDPDMRELIGLVLESEGHHVMTAPDGPAALALVANGLLAPDLLLADYNLPNGLNGLQLAIALRARLGAALPVIILTGDISNDTLRDVAAQHCTQLNKPVKHQELTRLIGEMLDAAPACPPAPIKSAPTAKRLHASTVFVVDDDGALREALRSVLEEDGRNAECFETAEAFLSAFVPCDEACLLIDACLPGMSGVELLRRLRQAGHDLPAIIITGQSDVPMAVGAMKAGAVDFIEKPVGRIELLASLDRALDQARDGTKITAWRAEAASHVASLTARQREIMTLVLEGHPSKNIAMDLGISQRTVENHRAAIMQRTGVTSLPALARLALAASQNDGAASSGAR
jgi:two-component system CheB/CheR fusion protein